MKKVLSLAMAAALTVSLFSVSAEKTSAAEVASPANGALAPASAAFPEPSGAPVVSAQKVYSLELERWGVYSDGTHPVETTNGINKALQWAREQGYTAFSVPAGTYLISKGDGTAKTADSSRINLVSGVDFALDAGAVIQKESNGYAGYSLLYAAPGVKNVTVKGGTYRGDRDTHDYYEGAKPWKPNQKYAAGDKVIPPSAAGDSSGYYYVAKTAGASGSAEPAWTWTKVSNDNTVAWQPVAKNTHEGGYGIITSGAENITFDGIKAVNFTGDGMALGLMGTLVKDIYGTSFKSGSVDEKGALIADSSKTRLENLPLTNANFGVQKTFQFIHQRNLPQGAFSYAAYFYKADGTFISKLKSSDLNTPVGWGLSPIPDGAASMNVVFDAPSVPSGAYVEFWMQGVSKNIVVKNSEFAFNRRQGITVGGAQDVLIQNNSIHDMKGTAPQSGIDVEAGYNLNNRIKVKSNSFYNNQAYDLILYDGKNAIVEGNRFSSPSIGLAISEPFKYATVSDNAFNGARIYAYNYATFKNNKMNGGLAAFLGSNLVIDGLDVTDTLVNLASSTPFGIEASNITATNTGKAFSQLGVNANPIHLKNVTIKGQAMLDSFAGNAGDGSTFDNLKVLGYTRTQLPRGTYTNCAFEAAPGQWGAAVNGKGAYEFNKCSFKGLSGFETNDVHGMPDSVILRNSTVEATRDNASAVSIQAGKRVVIENNALKAGSFPYSTLAAVQVGNYWTKSNAAKVESAVIKGNAITTKGNAPYGVSTVYAGTGAKPYNVENNILNGAKLQLRAGDISMGNR